MFGVDKPHTGAGKQNHRGRKQRQSDIGQKVV